MRVLLALVLALAALLVVAAFVLPLKEVYIPLPISHATPRGKAATERFWRIFQAERYEELPDVIRELTAVHDEEPPHKTVTNMLAAAHLWHFQERGRLHQPAKDLREDLVLALRYAEETLAMSPKEKIVPAITVTAAWQLAVIDDTPEKLPHIHFQLMENTEHFPEFHGFVQSWLLAAMLPADSPRFRGAQLGYHLMMNACAGFRTPRSLEFNRIVLSYCSLRALFSTRLCYNDTVAPHNLEGTFLAIGDHLVKQGKLDEARTWYGNARRLPAYGEWRYRPIIEDRLSADLVKLRAKFRADSGKLDVEPPAMSFQSSVTCATCHAR